MDFKWGLLCQDVWDHANGVFDLVGVANTLQAEGYPATFRRTLAVSIQGDESARGIRLSVTVRLAGEGGRLDQVWILHFVMPREPAVMRPTALGTFVFDELTLPEPGYCRFEVSDEDDGLLGELGVVAVKVIPNEVPDPAVPG